MQKIRKSFRSTAKSHKKFTLIELVVIVTIIAVTGTLLSALDSNTHTQAKQITCLDHLKKIENITQRYFDRYDERLVAYDAVVPRKDAAVSAAAMPRDSKANTCATGALPIRPGLRRL